MDRMLVSRKHLKQELVSQGYGIASGAFPLYARWLSGQPIFLVQPKVSWNSKAISFKI